MAKAKRIIISSKRLKSQYSGWGKFSQTLALYLQNKGIHLFLQEKFFSLSNLHNQLNGIASVVYFCQTRTILFPNFYGFNFKRIIIYRLLFWKRIIVRICANELVYHHKIKLFMLRFSHKIIVLNKTHQSLLQPLFGNKVVYIPNPVSQYFFPPSDNKPTNLRKDILFVGSICERKGVKELIQAYLNSSAAQDHQLILAGPLGHGESSPQYLKDIKALLVHPLAANIIMPGALSAEELKEHYANCKIFVLPSYSEGMPNALLEAMVNGMLCIGSDIPGIHENLQHEINGFLFEPGNTDQLITLLNSTVKKSDSTMAIRASDFIKQHRSPDIIFNNYIALI